MNLSKSTQILTSSPTESEMQMQMGTSGPGLVKRSWLERPSTEVAPDLVGCTLVRQLPDALAMVSEKLPSRLKSPRRKFFPLAR